MKFDFFFSSNCITIENLNALKIKIKIIQDSLIISFIGWVLIKFQPYDNANFKFT